MLHHIYCRVKLYLIHMSFYLWLWWTEVLPPAQMPPWDLRHHYQWVTCQWAELGPPGCKWAPDLAWPIPCHTGGGKTTTVNVWSHTNMTILIFHAHPAETSTWRDFRTVAQLQFTFSHAFVNITFMFCCNQNKAVAQNMNKMKAQRRSKVSATDGWKLFLSDGNQREC